MPNQRGKKGKRMSVKQRTRDRYIGLDGDLTGIYSDDDEFPVRGQKNSRRIPIKFPTPMRERTNTRLTQIKRSSGGRRDTVYKVTIRSKSKIDVDYVLDLFQKFAEKFLPFNIKEDDNKSLTFYVCTKEEAENIMLLNRRLSTSHDLIDKITIQTAMAPATWDSLDDRFKMAISDVVKSCYNAKTNSIDLSNFQNNRVFVDQNINSLCTLKRNSVLVETIRAIVERFPTVTGLSLKGNRLDDLIYVKSLTFACPNVIEIDLSDNYFKDMKELNLIRYWKIERICLENNPMCNEFKSTSSYAKAVHDHLPYVSFLDGAIVHVNPAKVDADIRRRSGILYPPVQKCYFPDENLKQRVEQLMFQFYELYDGPNKSRQMLIDAYHENATFSYAFQTLEITDDRLLMRGEKEALDKYMYSSRNIHQDTSREGKHKKVIYNGSMDIAVALSQLPQTEHDKSSFLFEFITVRQQFLIFTIRGIFRDGKDVGKLSGLAKFFTRTFAVVPCADERMAIVNDALLIAPINQQRLEKHNQLIKKMSQQVDEQQLIDGFLSDLTPTNLIDINTTLDNRPMIQAPVQQVQQVQQVASLPQPVVPPVQTQQNLGYDRNDPSVQKAMVDAFSQQSGMKPEWAKKCLEDMGWDFEAAGNAFNRVRSQIPADAFM